MNYPKTNNVSYYCIAYYINGLVRRIWWMK